MLLIHPEPASMQIQVNYCLSSYSHLTNQIVVCLNHVHNNPIP